MTFNTCSVKASDQLSYFLSCVLLFLMVPKIYPKKKVVSKCFKPSFLWHKVEKSHDAKIKSKLTFQNTLFLQVLNDFLMEINRKNSTTNFKAMISVLLGHSQSSNPSTQLIALIWILRFLELDGANLTSYRCDLYCVICYVGVICIV